MMCQTFLHMGNVEPDICNGISAQDICNGRVNDCLCLRSQRKPLSEKAACLHGDQNANTASVGGDQGRGQHGGLLPANTKVLPGKLIHLLNLQPRSICLVFETVSCSFSSEGFPVYPPLKEMFSILSYHSPCRTLQFLLLPKMNLQYPLAHFHAQSLW